jgi:hypothetical protein
MLGNHLVHQLVLFKQTEITAPDDVDEDDTGEPTPNEALPAGSQAAGRRSSGNVVASVALRLRQRDCTAGVETFAPITGVPLSVA